MKLVVDVTLCWGAWLLGILVEHRGRTFNFYLGPLRVRAWKVYRF